MVQRKVPNKLGNQADHVKTDNKLLGNLKPSISQHPDGKNKGADLKKKKMKKSRSFKRSDFDVLKSPSLRREKPKPEIPQKKQQQQPPIKISSDGSPNYMKSTSCSDARKEISQVSSRNSQTGTDLKTPPKLKNSSYPKLVSSVSGHGHKPARTLTRTSSLKKLVRTLTKTPSFKPSRASTKKCSKVVLCENLDIQRSTCSSTLKDSKFPTFLTLNPGGTELEGTSVMKVCPYTYCSLNGHHHPPLPPLKHFLAAKRRILKTQKSMKLGMREIGGGHDIDIDIYIKERGDHGPHEFAVDYLAPTGDEDDELAADGLAESLSDEQLQSEIDVEDNSDVNSDVNSTEMEMAEFLFSEEDQNLGLASNEAGEPDSEASDMDWEEGPYSANSTEKTKKGSDLEGVYSWETDNHSFGDEPIPKSHDMVISYFEEIPADERVQEIFDDESRRFGDDLNWESDSSTPVPEIQSNGQVSQTYNAFEEQTTQEAEETYLDSESDDIAKTTISSSHIEEPNEEPKVDIQTGVDEKECTINTEDERLIAHGNDNCTEQDQEVTCGDFALNNNVIEVCQSSDVIETDGSQEEVFEGSIVPEANNSETEQNFLEQELPTELVDASKSPVEEMVDEILMKDFSEAVHDKSTENNGENQIEAISQETKANLALAGDGLLAGTQGQSSDKQSQSDTANEIPNLRSSDSQDEEENRDEEIIGKLGMEVEKEAESNAEERTSTIKSAAFNRQSKSNQKLPDTCNNQIRITRSEKPIEDLEEPKDFNPREPNYLPVELDPEGEKVDLKHQMMNERKNAEEWMLDYALRQAVTKLAPARKRKVALLVEAFEAVAPIPKYESRLRRSPTAFSHSWPIQACN